MSNATHNESMRMLRRIAEAGHQSAVREYRRQRVQLTTREVMEESAEEIRRAVRGIITTPATD